MTVRTPTPEEKQILQKFYVASRSLLASGVSAPISIQRSFEEAMAGYLGEEVWRPTHISPAAAYETLHVSHRNIQRAHGIIEGRLDRYERTIAVLTGHEKDFDEWLSFWLSHDKTILITREEHGVNKKFAASDLIEIPTEKNLFLRGGFSFKYRKKAEGAWLKTLANASLAQGPDSGE
jgi:hypothetical protein